MHTRTSQHTADIPRLQGEQAHPEHPPAKAEKGSSDPGTRSFFQAARRRLARKESVVLLIVLLAFSLRLRTALFFPWTFDEYHYLIASNNYAHWALTGRFSRLLTARQNYMHPVLVKYLFAAAILMARSGGDPEINRVAARTVSVLAGTACVAVLAWLCPLAGLALALHTIAVKFHGLAYLDSVPMLFSFLSVVCLEKAEEQKNNRWLYASAFFLGAAGASKYPYLVVAPVLLGTLLYRDHGNSKRCLVYLLMVLVTFVCLNPVWWVRSTSEIAGTFRFHLDYTHSRYVSALSLPWYQPLLYLTGPKPLAFEPTPVVQLDLWIALTSLAGLGLLWKRKRIYAWWYGTALVVLVIWPTKWSHYPMILLVPFCLSSGLFLEQTILFFGQRIQKTIGGDPTPPPSLESARRSP